MSKVSLYMSMHFTDKTLNQTSKSMIYLTIKET